MPTVSAHVAQTLAAHIDHVFGVMGNGNAHFLDALERSTDVHYTAVRHEAGGVVAADAYFARADASPRRPPPTAPASPTR
jgi:thiamine pyrophosphate-dependent acetolactate synthase large subunit-like protein